MIKLYWKEYRYRAGALVTAVMVSVIAVIAAFAINNRALVFCSTEITALDDTHFQYGYFLNYSSDFDNEYLYTSSDILLYTDENRSERIAATSVMELPDRGYSDSSLLFNGRKDVLDTGCAEISKNIAIKYGLSAGDILYAEMPYTTELQRVTVTAIGRSDYGIENPRVSSELGVVCLGYVPQHHESVIGKYILFSNRSMASELSQFPQIIDSTFSRSQLVAAVQKETMPFVLWYCFAGAVILVGQWLLVFRKSAASIDIRRRKGMVAGQCFMVSLIEKTVMILVPVITTAAIMCWALQLASIYIAIMILSVIMAIVMIGVAVIAEAIIRR